MAAKFLSTPSARRATSELAGHIEGSDISIHALREEGDRHLLLHVYRADPISIHALREEGDGLGDADVRSGNISIHALREEGDRLFAGWQITGQRFLSTPSARRATTGLTIEQEAKVISIHALREEGDLQASVA